MKKIAIVLAVSVLGASVAWACPECHHHCRHHDYYRSDFSDAVALIALLAIGAGIAEQLQTTPQPAATVEQTPLPSPAPRQTRTVQSSFAPVYVAPASPAAPVYTAPASAVASFYSSPASTAVSHPRFVEPIQPIQPVKFPVINFYNY